MWVRPLFFEASITVSEELGDEQAAAIAAGGCAVVALRSAVSRGAQFWRYPALWCIAVQPVRSEGGNAGEAWSERVQRWVCSTHWPGGALGLCQQRYRNLCQFTDSFSFWRKES